MSEGVVHIAGLDVEIGPRLRQRCAWCGAVLIDVDQTLVAVKIPEGKTEKQARADGDLKMPTWAVGSLVMIDGGVKAAVEHKDGERLPSNCCGSLDAEATL